jgi:hypothetical protein
VRLKLSKNQAIVLAPDFVKERNPKVNWQSSYELRAIVLPVSWWRLKHCGDLVLAVRISKR